MEEQFGLKCSARALRKHRHSLSRNRCQSMARFEVESSRKVL